jgi:hypothetical protein
MNLLNEIQETTLMMNLYQQQQLQQQQQQLQQQQVGPDHQGAGSDPQMAMLLQQQQGIPGGGMDQLYGNGGVMGHRGSLGMGGNDQQMHMMRQQQQQQQLMQAGASVGAGGAGGAGNIGAGGGVPLQHELMKGQQEQAALEERLQKLKEDIALRQKEAEEMGNSDIKGLGDDAAVKNEKRKGGDEEKAPAPRKRPKLETPGSGGENNGD